VTFSLIQGLKVETSDLQDLYKSLKIMSDKFQNKYRIPSARAKWWDYEKTASYFITICTYQKEHFFGKIDKNQMLLSKTGEIAGSCWEEIPKHFQYVTLGAFIVMPNHIHGIVFLDNTKIYAPNIVETLHATSPHESLPHPISDQTALFLNHQKNEKMASISPKKGSLASVLRSYKSAVSKLSRPLNLYFNWQERYHDHIIRNKESFDKIEHYITNNPSNWNDDCFFY
jgi:putative transposase